MKKLFILPLLLASTFLFANYCNEFKEQQRKMERAIEKQYKRDKITHAEYRKLMNEQEHIKYAIEKYDRDEIWTQHEINVVRGKLQRAEVRLKRYKTNWEE